MLSKAVRIELNVIVIQLNAVDRAMISIANATC